VFANERDRALQDVRPDILLGKDGKDVRVDAPAVRLVDGLLLELLSRREVRSGTVARGLNRRCRFARRRE